MEPEARNIAVGWHWNTPTHIFNMNLILLQIGYKTRLTYKIHFKKKEGYTTVALTPSIEHVCKIPEDYHSVRYLVSLVIIR